MPAILRPFLRGESLPCRHYRRTNRTSITNFIRLISRKLVFLPRRSSPRNRVLRISPPVPFVKGSWTRSMATFMVFLMSIHVRRTIVNLLLSSRDSRFSSHLSRIPFFFLHPRQIYRGDIITSERRGKFFNWHSSQFAGISTTNSYPRSSQITTLPAERISTSNLDGLIVRLLSSRICIILGVRRAASSFMERFTSGTSTNASRLCLRCSYDRMKFRGYITRGDIKRRWPINRRRCVDVNRIGM